MNDLYLIAHKVRGEPAFDIAERMECPLCSGRGARYTDEGHDIMCTECEADGYWWIIPTSGHRAYPYWHHELADLCDDVGNSFEQAVPELPSDWPDHYPLRHSPSALRINILSLLPQEPKATIRRRL